MGFLGFLSGFAQGMDLFATRVQLGDFEFLDFEVPERVALGAKQQTVVHKMVGGVRVVDVLGVDYDAIRWSGIFTGQETASRIQMLEQMRDAGAPLTFTLDDYSFEVLITHFEPVYEFVYRRPYNIELEVIKRNDAASGMDALSDSLDSLINSDIGQSLGLANVIDVQAVSDAVSSVQAAVQQVQDFANATVAAVQSVVRPIMAAQQIVQKTIANVESSLLKITTLGGLVPGNPVAAAVANLGKQARAATQLPALYQLSNVLGRLNKNVQAGPTANGVRTVTQTGGTLYQVASEHAGDASKWTDVAAVNGLSDPQLNGIKTLTVPDRFS